MADLTQMGNQVEQPAQTMADGHLFVLSAVNQERLRAYAGKVVTWLQSTGAAQRLLDAIYTWQVGRSPMRYRLAIRAADREDLCAKLRRWLEHPDELPDTWTGEVSRRAAKAARPAADKSGQERVDQAVASRDWRRIGELWVAGADIEWRKLYAGDGADKPKRISLPTYPFARERHWIEVPDVEPQAAIAVKPVAAAPGETMQHLFLAPVWELEPVAKQGGADSGAGVRHHVALCEMGEVDLEQLESLLDSSECDCSHVVPGAGSQDTGARYLECAVACFGVVQKILTGKPQSKVLFQLVVPDEPDPALLAGLSGLLKTAAQENPNFTGQVILTTAQSSLQQLAEQLRVEKGQLDEAVIRYDRHARHVLRWRAAGPTRESEPDVSTNATTFKDGGIYLITGGLGGLGRVFAREILRTASKPRIILTGRAPLSGTKQADLEALSREALAQGASAIVYRQVDLDSRDQVRELILGIQREYGQLNGIIHSAGMLSDNFIAKKSAEEFRQVLAPKVTGTVNLDVASCDIDLDFLVLFSSVTSVTGNAGQVDYAAANGFLDQFSVWRNRLVESGKRRGHTLAINWPLWRDGGMEFDRDTLEAVRRTTGLHPMQTATGLRTFYQSLSLRCARVMVLEGEIDKLSATLARGTVNAAAIQQKVALSIDSERLAEETLKKLEQVFAEVTKRPLARIDAHEELASYGIDSIIINALNFRLSQVFGEISRTLFFEFKTLNDLTGYLVREHAVACAAWTGLEAREAAAAGAPAASVAPAARGTPAARGMPMASVLPTAVAAPAHGEHRQRVPATQVARSEPIAIIGISGRYPQASNLDEFWANLEAGRNCISEIPPERWSLEGFYQPDVEQALEQGRSYSKWGGFIEQFAHFDPLFFNISPREALNMDPQERLFLQEVWRALEDAGYTRADLKSRFKQRVGVFAGITKSGFNLYAAQFAGAAEPFFPYTSFGSVANRASYFLDITGPSLPLDTMCSSSLTAIHEACEYINRGDCEMAFAGGVNLYLHPSTYTWLCSQQMLARDGLCRSFGAGGSGYVPGEGVGVVLLKSLSAAVRDNDHIYGVILASQVNHGGKTNAYSVPNPKAQAELIRRTLDKAGIKASEVSYIEAHGTGTELGDPIEISGLQQAFAPDTREIGCCKIGSVKSNIGHLEAAAGVAGLSKVLLQMKHQQLAPSLHAARLNPNIAFNKTAFSVNTGLCAWQPRSPSGASVARTAGISSFGAGGANAHIIVQEYVEPQTTVATNSADDRLIIPLSAKTSEQLQDRARDLLRFIQTAAGPIDLAAMAYTLQAGREAMHERLGCLVSSVEQLAQKLRAWIAGEKEIEDLYRGQVSSGRDTLDLIGADEDFVATVDRWMARRKLSKLLELWTKGLDFDWNKLYGEVKPRRLALPVYPFAKERYWVDAIQMPQRPVGAAGSAVLHPLVHNNTSVLSRQSYSSVFTGAESFLKDHTVGGQKVLPAVAYLEMARAAVDLAAPPPADTIVLELRNTVWAQPITVSDSREVTTVLYPDESGDPQDGADQSEILDFEICSDETLHCQGQAVFAHRTESTKLDIARLKAQMTRGTVDVSGIYATFGKMGVSYGPSHRAISSVYLGEKQLLAHLRLPDAVASTLEDYRLHPSLLDGALQTPLALMGESVLQLGQALLPFALDTLRVISGCTKEMFAWVRYSAGCDVTAGLPKFDVDLCDQAGNVCVQLHGFTSRAREEDRQAAGSRLHSLVPVWQRIPRQTVRATTLARSARVLLVGGDSRLLTWAKKSQPEADLLQLPPGSSQDSIQQALADRSFDHVLWIAPDVTNAADASDAEPRRIIDRQEEGVLAVFRFAKALLALGYADADVQWTLVTRNTQGVKENDRIAPTHAGVIGLAGSLAKEYPQWHVRLLDVDSLDSVSASECLSIANDAPGRCLACRRGEWFGEGLARVTSLPESPPAYRQNGVYVVIGGAGGLGEVWSRFMVEHYRARLVWIGRRELDAGIEAKIQSLGRLGPAPMYVSADATRLDSLQAAFERITSRYPVIQGVVHSAIDLKDRSLALMDEPTFRASLSAKVDASLNMDRVFGAQDLDFMLFFSSLISYTRAPGQSNYAAGCTFKDSFAHSLAQRRRYPVKIMNWGYWGDVGVVTSDFYNKRMQEKGIGSIQAGEAMDCLQRLISSSMPQLAVLKTLDDRAIEDVALRETVTWLPQNAQDVLPQACSNFRASFQGKSHATLKDDDLPAEMLGMAADILASSLVSAGLVDSRLCPRNVGAVSPALERWLSASLDYLFTQECTVGTLDEMWREWRAKKGAWLANPNIHSHITLLEACLEALPEIVIGKRPATDVMFPDSSMRLVEGLYKGYALADYCNDVLGAVLSACIEQKRHSDVHSRVRILEIGAGTGGTTARILPLLRKHGAAIEEYCYTDLSKAFLIHAEEHYRPQLPSLTTAIFDVSRPLELQSVASHGYDFVIATNVLHATADIRGTLRNAKALLKSRGVLLINEMSTWSLFSHLTFGLLEGWWLYDDAQLRLPASPGLAPQKWQDVLQDEGFESVVFPATEAHELGQQIIAATSDGRVRQRMTPASPVALQPSVSPQPTAAANPTGALNPTGVVKATPVAAESSLRDRAIAYLRDVVAGTLRLEASQVHPERPLADYGLDSILVVGLTNQLRKVFPGVTSTLFFEVRNVAALADYILQNKRAQLLSLLGTTGPSAAASQSASSPTVNAPTHSRGPAVAAPTKTNLRRLRRGRREPAPEATRGPAVFDVAIIGLSGRYPQAANLSELWSNLASGRNCVTEIPAERWNWRDYFDPEKGKPGKTYSRWGGFLRDIDCFDPMFFRISPKEAKVMDPQERLFLESCYHAIEDAGYTPQTVANRDKMGVFVGVMNARYNSQPLYYSIANRVSFVFDFQGPSMAVDTACSSSLTAIHLALESLYSGSSECAIAGGVNLIIDPVHYLELSALTMLSAGDQCRSFANQADGFVDAEGVGAVVLKPLKLAERDGDHIYAIIKASAVNAGGKTNGYTVPNPNAQSAVVAKALQRANLPADHVTYIEAHGTGTALGDPIEIAALTQIFAGSCQAEPFCAIGSLKSNLGHCESAAGIAGLTKVLLQLQHQQLAPSLHAEVTNPEIDFSQTPFRLQKKLQEWPRPRREINGQLREIPRIAGISSFGAGGANAHIIVQEYEPRRSPPAGRGAPLAVIPLSARTSEQLTQKASDLLQFIRARGRDGRAVDPHALAYTLQVGRESMEERVGLIVSSIDDLADKLEAFGQGEQNIDGLYRARVKRYQEVLPEARSDLSDADRDAPTLLQSWMKGGKVDWNRVYGETRPERMSLPNYPFARERYWRDRTETVPTAVPDATAPRTAPHPLLHDNISDIEQQCYRSTFTGNEPFLVDHQMVFCDGAERKVVPAVLYLEIARAAVENAAAAQRGATPGHRALELFNVVWADPATVTSSMQLGIALFARDDDQLDYEIHSLAADGALDIVHCQGQAFLGRQTEPARIDLTRLQSQMRKGRRTSPSLYSSFSAAGVHYGPGYQAVTDVYVGEKQVLAELRLPSAALSDPSVASGELVLHPIMMDGALQAALDLLSSGNCPSLPLAVESLRIFAACPQEMAVWARYSEGNTAAGTNIQLDVDLCDRQGNVCIQMRGVTYERASKPQSTHATQAGQLLPHREPFKTVVVERTGIALSAPESQTFTRNTSSKPTRISLGGEDLTP